MSESGPVGFRFIEDAPRDGTWLRLRFRQRSGDIYRDDEVIGQWQDHAEMKTGGSWFDRQGFYITPGPIFWSPTTPPQ